MYNAWNLPSFADLIYLIALGERFQKAASRCVQETIQVRGKGNLFHTAALEYVCVYVCRDTQELMYVYTKYQLHYYFYTHNGIHYILCVKVSPTQMQLTFQ